jgi:hypothetical protein
VSKKCKHLYKISQPVTIIRLDIMWQFAPAVSATKSNHTGAIAAERGMDPCCFDYYSIIFTLYKGYKNSALTHKSRVIGLVHNLLKSPKTPS